MPTARLRFYRKLTRYFREYSRVTEVHGLRYLGENRTLFEKIFWIFVSLLSLFISFVMVAHLYLRYEKTPVIVNFASQTKSIGNIPFPAVTICPEIKALRARQFHFEKLFDLVNTPKFDPETEIDEESFTWFQYIYMLCTHSDKHYLGNLKVIERSDDFFKTLFESRLDMDFVLTKCKLFGQEFNCSDHFFPVLTDQGICYSFNMVDKSHIFKKNMYLYRDLFTYSNKSNSWILETGYRAGTPANTYPRRAHSSGADNGLSLVLRSPKYRHNICSMNLLGYKIHLDHPMSAPVMSQQYFHASINEVMMVSIRPNVLFLSKGFGRLSLNKRKCFISNEQPLKFFKSYSRPNCYSECLANYTLSKCRCVDFHMPRENVTPLCGPANIPCMEKARLEFQDKILSQNHKVCSVDCMSVCFGLHYDVTISSAKWEWQSYYKALGKSDENDTEMTDLSMVNLFFKSEHFTELTRSEIYDSFELVAQFGGLLSLFLGISLITFVELLYFLTLRIICNVRLYGEWFG